MNKSDWFSAIALAISGLTFVWSIIWSVFLHRRQQAKDRKQVLAEFTTHPRPAIKVINTGNVPVFVTAVDLALASGNVFHLQIVIRLRALPHVSGELGTEQWQLVGRQASDEALEIGNAEFFVLPEPQRQTCKEFLDLAKNSAQWISVFSHSEELFRLQGNDVLAYLKEAEKRDREG